MAKPSRLLSFACQRGTSSGGDKVRIGVLMSLTGDTANFGISSSNAIRMAADEVNTAGGINGKQIELLVEDDRSDPTEAANITTKFVSQDQVHAILGEVGSSRTLAAAPIAQNAKIPMLTPSSTNAEVTRKGNYIFRSCFIDTVQGPAMAQFAVKSLNAKRAALMIDRRNDYSPGQRIRILIVIGAILAASAPSIASLPAKKLDKNNPKLFAYDRSVAFDLKEEPAKEQEGVTIRDVNYAAYAQKHGRIKAYLIQPSGKGPFAGVLFFHWLGDVKSDRTEFLDEAVALAKEGTASLLIQGYFPWSEEPTEGETDHQQIVDQTIEVRRALDLLLSQPKVDRRQLGFVGHDYGAMFGTIVSGIDKRVKTYVLIAGMGGFSDWSLKYWSGPSKKGADVYKQAVKDVDPIGYVSTRRRPRSYSSLPTTTSLFRRRWQTLSSQPRANQKKSNGTKPPTI